MPNPELPTDKIAIPCVDCPLAALRSDPQVKPDPQVKVNFSASGKITYFAETDCGVEVVNASGPRLEQVQDNIINCTSPEKYSARVPGVLGRIGISQPKLDCPAIPVDPTSRRQLTDFFRGDE